MDAGPAGEGEAREVANERGACGREAGGRRAAAARDARTNAAAERGRRERGNARAGSAEDGVARRSAAAGGSGGGDPRRERADPNEAAEARSRARDAARRHIADDAPTGMAASGARGPCVEGGDVSLRRTSSSSFRSARRH